jgi:hypothetical protein
MFLNNVSSTIVEDVLKMYKTASRKIGFSLIGLIFLTGAAILTPSLCGAGMHELSDGDMAAVYAQGFSTFTLTGSTVTLDFSGVTLSTWTEISSMNMGYYLKGGTTAWDNSWTGVSLGSQSTDLVAQGLYIEAGFSNITDPATRQLEYVRIGTHSLTGDISANFISFSGTLDNGVTNITRTNLGQATISASGTGFYLALDRIGTSNQMGYSFNWAGGTPH